MSILEEKFNDLVNIRNELNKIINDVGRKMEEVKEVKAESVSVEEEEQKDYFEPDLNYLERLKGFLEKNPEGEFLVSDLTDKESYFVEHLKYYIKYKGGPVDVTFNDDYSKFRTRLPF